MRVRLSTVIGLPVVDDAEGRLGAITGIFLNPDTGAVEGFFVGISGFFSFETLFLPVSAIEHWGARVRVRDREALSPIGELVRLARLQEEGRPVLGQPIITDTGRRLGRCRDVQFDTRSFRMEWLFPKTFLQWKRPLPLRSIIEVRPDAVVVREEENIPAMADDAAAAINTIETLATTPAARVILRQAQDDKSL